MACIPISVSPSSVVCALDMMAPLEERVHAVLEVTAHSFSGNDTVGYWAPCYAVGVQTPCGFIFDASHTPTVTSVAVSDPVTNTGTMTITGTLLIAPLEVRGRVSCTHCATATCAGTIVALTVQLHPCCLLFCSCVFQFPR